MKVIALQTTEIGQGYVRRSLDREGLTEGQDYTIFTEYENIDAFADLVRSGSRQVLIAGSLLGKGTDLVNRLVLALKGINQQLVAIRFSSIQWDGPFEDILDYDMSDEDFERVLKKYLQ